MREDESREGRHACRSRCRCGRIGPLRHFGGVHDADVAGLQLARDAGLLRALQQRFVDLTVALGVALQHAVLDALAVQAERLGLLRFERADQAVLLRQRRLVFGLHRLDDLVDLARRAWPASVCMAVRIFTISGCRSPYFSASCACCRCRSRNLGSSASGCSRSTAPPAGVDGRRALRRPSAGCRALPSRCEPSSPCVTAPFRSARRCTTMFWRSSTATASCCSLYFCSAASLCLDLLALLGQPIAQPVGRVLRGREADLDVLLDVGLRVRVGHVGGEHGIGRREANLDQPAVADRRDSQRPEHLVDVRRQRIGGFSRPGDRGRLLRRAEHLPLDPGAGVPDHPRQAERPDGRPRSAIDGCSARFISSTVRRARLRLCRMRYCVW